MFTAPSSQDILKTTNPKQFVGRSIMFTTSGPNNSLFRRSVKEWQWRKEKSAQHIPVGIFQSWIQLFAAFHGLVARKTFSVDIPLIRVYLRFKLIRLDRKRLSSFFFVGQLGFWPRIRHYKSDKGKKNSQSRRCKMLYTTRSRVNIGLRLAFWRHKWKRWPISEQANNFQDGGMPFAFLTPL